MNKPKLLVIITIILWSLSAYPARQVSIKSEFLLISISFFFTLLTFIIYNILSGASIFLKLKKLKIKFLFFGILGYFVYWTGYIQSSRAFDSASETTILNYTWPVFTIIFTDIFFRKEAKSFKLRLIEVVGIIFSFTSIVILATGGNLTSFDISNIKGLSWGLLAGISYGLFSAFSSSIKKEEHSIFLLASIFISWIFALIFSFSEVSLIKTLTIKDILLVAFLGCLIDGIGYITWTKANRLASLKKINITSIASLVYILPVLSLINIAITLKETQLFQPHFIFSLISLLFGSIICQKSKEILKRFKRK